MRAKVETNVGPKSFRKFNLKFLDNIIYGRCFKTGHTIKNRKGKST